MPALRVAHRGVLSQPLKWTIEGKDIEPLGRVPLDIQISRPVDARHPFMVDSENPDGRAVFLQIAIRIAQKLRSALEKPH